MNNCSITATNGGYILRTPYDPGLVAALKANVPTTDRKFDPTKKVWVVSPSYGKTIQTLVMQFFNELVMLPQMSVKVITQMKLLEVRYIGSCKEREDGQRSSFAWVNNEWSAIFPEDVLRVWFETGPAPIEPPSMAATLYSMLGIVKTAAPDEIKTAFRKMARQWHPDVCKEPNAHETFIRIKEASDILSDPRLRGRYDAGLVLEASLQSKQMPAQLNTQYVPQYQAPLRSGWIMAEGVDTVGRFVVSHILQWEEIVQGDQVLVSSWPLGANRPVENWC